MSLKELNLEPQWFRTQQSPGQNHLFHRSLLLASHEHFSWDRKGLARLAQFPECADSKYPFDTEKGPFVSICHICYHVYRLSTMPCCMEGGHCCDPWWVDDNAVSFLVGGQPGTWPWRGFTGHVFPTMLWAVGNVFLAMFLFTGLQTLRACVLWNYQQYALATGTFATTIKEKKASCWG